MASEIQEAWENFANAIIMGAVDDYKNALIMAIKNPKSRAAKMAVRREERFFYSEWFDCLTNLEGGYLVRKIKESVDEKYGRSKEKHGQSKKQ